MKIRLPTLALVMTWLTSALRQEPSEEAVELRREIEEKTKSFLYQRDRANRLAMQSRSLETQLSVVRKKESVLEAKLERIDDALHFSDSSANWSISSQAHETISGDSSLVPRAAQLHNPGTFAWPKVATVSPETPSNTAWTADASALAAATADSSASQIASSPSTTATTVIAATSTTVDPLDIAYQTWEGTTAAPTTAAAASDLYVAATTDNSEIHGHTLDERQRRSRSAAAAEPRETTQAPMAQVQPGSSIVSQVSEQDATAQQSMAAAGAPSPAELEPLAGVGASSVTTTLKVADAAQPESSLADFDKLEVKLKEADKSLEESHPQSDSDAFDAYEKTFQAAQSKPSTSVTTTMAVTDVSTAVPAMEVQTVAGSTGNAFDNVEVKLQNEEKRIDDMDNENTADEENESSDGEAAESSEAPPQQTQAAAMVHDGHPVVSPQPLATPSSLDAEAQGAQQFLSQLMRSNPGLAMHRTP